VSVTPLAAPPDPASTRWLPLGAYGGLPTPVVNGQWIKGVGGAAVWAPIAQADLPDNLNVRNAGYATDLNNCTANGWYSWQPSTANIPASGYGYLQTQVLTAAGNYRQFAWLYNSDQAWIRRMQDSGAWGAWVRTQGSKILAWYGPYTLGPVTVNLNTYWHGTIAHNLGTAFPAIQGYIEDRSYGINLTWAIGSDSDPNTLSVFLTCVGNAGGGGSGTGVWHGYLGI
jgi:hypothetical protein